MPLALHARPPRDSGTGSCPGPALSGTALAAVQRQIQADALRPPAAMAVIHTEGTLPHQGIHDSSAAARRDLPLMFHAALLWQATGDGNGWRFAHRYLLDWVRIYRPSLNPIDETGFDALIATYALIGPTLPEGERRMIRAYLRGWGWAYAGAMRHPGPQGSWRNNWQSHRVKLLTLLAVASEDPAMFDAARQLFRQQVQINIRGDGEVIDYRQRDALHYVVYDLQPLLQAARAAQHQGEDWYHWRNTQGASLATAVAWLQPYAEGRLRHREFVHSQVRFDALRAQAGLPGFKGEFDPAAAAAVYQLAAHWDPSLGPLAARLASPPPLLPDVCSRRRLIAEPR